MADGTDPAPHRFAIGITDLGPQLRYQINPHWAGEARFVTGTASSNEGQIRSQVFGLRGYRFFDEHRRCKLYLGMEGALAKTSIQSTSSSASPTGNSVAEISGFGSTSGYALGGFAGVELRVTRRIAFDADMGPYLIGLKEKVTGASDSSWDFVMNAAVIFYIF